MEKSCVHVYTGEGKGKTTCAFGLALRCAGNGYKVKIIQFLKTSDTGEVQFLKNSDIQVYRFEEKHGFTNEMTENEKEDVKLQSENAMKFARIMAESGDCDMVVLDEIVCSYVCGFVTKEQILELIDNRGETELVLTGRGAPDWLTDLADYVTVMDKRKHPYDKKLSARKGIEF